MSFPEKSGAISATALRIHIRQDREGCELEIETIPAVTFCEDCEETYGTVEYGKTCPYCGSEHTFLIQGNEHQIKEIEVT